MRVRQPPTIMNAKPLLSSFNKNAHNVGMNVLELLAGHLDILPDELTGRHVSSSFDTHCECVQ